MSTELQCYVARKTSANFSADVMALADELDLAPDLGFMFEPIEGIGELQAEVIKRMSRGSAPPRRPSSPSRSTTFAGVFVPACPWPPWRGFGTPAIPAPPTASFTT